MEAAIRLGAARTVLEIGIKVREIGEREVRFLELEAIIDRLESPGQHGSAHGFEDPEPRVVHAITTRLKKLEQTVPRCDPRVRRLAGPDHAPCEADWCPWCGGYRVLVINEVIVALHADAERVTGVKDREHL